MKYRILTIILFSITVISYGQEFSVTYPSSFGNKVLDGRLLVILSKNPTREPRFQIADDPSTQQIFGMDVEDWKPGTTKVLQSNAVGYPFESLAEIKNGEYHVQVLLHLYETFHKKDGHVLKLPMDRGEGQHWNLAPGNLYSETVKINLNKKNTYNISLSKIIPPIKEPDDTKYIKHIKIQSKMLTEYWGRPMYLGAHILLPQGWENHPTVKYPLAIYHGHYPSDFEGFRTTPPDENLKPDTSARFGITGYNRIVQQEAYDFYKIWTGTNFPRVLAIEIQHPTPYFLKRPL